MHPGSFNIGVLHALGLQPFSQVAVGRDEAVFCAARYPQQTNLLVRLGVEAWKILFKSVRHSARTKRADPRELVEAV